VADATAATTAKGRQDGGYEVPILAEPRGGPIPKWTGDSAADLQEAGTGTSREDRGEGPDERGWRAAVAAFLAAWPALAEPIVAQLAAGAERASSVNVAGLGALGPSGDVVRDVSLALSRAMTDLAVKAADQVVADAAVQGADITTAEPDQGRLNQVAAATAALIVAGYASTAVQAALAAPAGTASAAVNTALTTLGAAQRGMVAAHVAAALTAAQHEGRRAVFAAHPPETLRASEVADRVRCGPCADVHGRVYNTLADALQDYPGFGGYYRCEGRLRCRGRLVGSWTPTSTDPNASGGRDDSRR